MIDQWFKDNGDFTLNIDHPLTADSIIWEVGGYHGLWASRMWEKYHCNIHIFDPVNSHIERIRKIFSGCDRVHVHQEALGSYSGRIGIHEAGDASFITRDILGAKEVTDIIKVSDLIKDTARIDLMNINIEGMEYELLFDLLINDVIKKIDIIQIQFHNSLPNAETMRFIIRKWLGITHEETYCYDFVWECWKLKNG